MKRWQADRGGGPPVITNGSLRRRAPVLPPALDDLPVAVVAVAAEVGSFDVNREWSALTGMGRRASLGAGWLDALDPPSRSEAATMVRGLLAHGGTASGEWRLADGGRWVAAVARANGGPGEPVATLVLHDVTAHRARHDDLVRRADHDDLTGLPGRRVLADRAGHALARLARRPGACAVLYIDLDGFKSVNDRLGHRDGDAMLVALAGRITRVLRPTDTLARVGGDEFVLLCEDLAGPSAAVSLADRVLAATRQAVDLPGGRRRVTASVGVAFADRPDEDVEGLIARADAAMYRAKRSSGDRIEVDAVPAGAVEARAAERGPAPPGDLRAVVVDLGSATDARPDGAGGNGRPAPAHHPAADDGAAHRRRRAHDAAGSPGGHG